MENLKQYDELYSLPIMWWVKKKILREWSRLLFKIRFKKSTAEYLGLKLNLPLTSWLGKYLVVPNEFFMSKTIHAALEIKHGVALDVGTHAGEFLVRYKAACKSAGVDNACYFGFEPNHASFSFVNELININDWQENSNVLPVALANSTELKTFYASRYADPCASIHNKINSGTKGFNSIVPVYKADELVKQLKIENISIIKIDVEGAELDVIKGLKSTIEKFQPTIHCELANIPLEESDSNYNYILDNNRKLIKLVTELGYQSYRIIEDGEFYHHAERFKNYKAHLSGPLEINDIPHGGNYVIAHKESLSKFLSLMGHVSSK